MSKEKILEAEELYRQGYNCFQTEPDQAIEFFGKAIELSPFFTEAYNGLAVLTSDKGDHEVALEFAKRAVIFRPENYTFLDSYWKNC